MSYKLSTTSKSTVRDIRLDGLRVIGLFAIILAHVHPPSLIFQLRNFDVPLMVLVSGAVYGLSSGSSKKYLFQISGRIFRLVAPTWVFLLIFFLSNLLTGVYFSKEIVFSSFALMDGIGYVWIIRVFILVSLIAPFFIYLYEKIHNKIWYLLNIFAIYLFYYFLVRIYLIIPADWSNSIVDFFFRNIVFYLLPYGFVAGLGVYLLKATKQSIVALFLFFSVIFMTLAYRYSVSQFIPTQMYKYPPDIYYLSYALAISLFLYLCSNTGIFVRIFKIRILQFIASSSLWIYLWQIFFLFQWHVLVKFIPNALNSFMVKFIIIISFSVFVTYLQKRWVRYVTKRVKSKFFKTMLNLFFLK